MTEEKSQRLYFHAQREPQNILQRHIMVLEFGTDIEVTRTHLVEETYTLGSFAFCFGNLPGDALSKSSVQSELGRHKIIVAVGISPGLAFPKLMAIDRIKIDTGLQRL